MCKHTNSTVTECKLCEHEHWIEIVENRNRFLVSRNKKHKNKIQELEAKVKGLEAQLPEGMKDCIILFKSCEKGHGTLTATNWIQHECQACKIEKLDERWYVLKAGIEMSNFCKESIDGPFVLKQMNSIEKTHSTEDV